MAPPHAEEKAPPGRCRGVGQPNRADRLGVGDEGRNLSSFDLKIPTDHLDSAALLIHVLVIAVASVKVIR